MHRALALIVSLLVLAGPAAAGVASADDRDSRSADFTVTLVTTSYTPGQLYADQLGNRYYQGSTFFGQAYGWPFNGSFRIDGDIELTAGSASAELDGSFVLTDVSGASVHGDVRNGRIQNVFSGQPTISARVRFDGGTGFLSGASGNARLTGSVPVLSQASAFSSQLGQPQVLYGQPVLGQPPVIYSPTAIAQPASPVGVTGPTMSLTGSLSLNDWTYVPTLQTWGNPYGSGLGVAPSFEDNVRPGNGWGDRNHLHTGPPGSTDDRDDRGNGRGRGRGRD